MGSIGIFLGLGVVIAAFVMATSAMSRAARAERQAFELRQLVQRLLDQTNAPPSPPDPQFEPSPEETRSEPEAPPQPVALEPAPPEPVEAPQKEQEPQRTDQPPLPPEPTTPSPAAGQATAAESAFTSQWMVWIGGLSLALGGVFLVKYSIDQGLLSPSIRILLGIVAGAAMLAVGEYTRRHSLPINLSFAQPDYIPATVSAAGVVTLFAVTYAGYALYDLVPSIIAFALLAGIALGGLALSLLHGAALAILGLAGSLLVPLLVASDQPSAIALFAYLAVVVALMGATGRLRAWWWLAWAAIYGGAIWVMIWLATSESGSGTLALSAFILFLGLLPLWVAPKPDREIGLFGFDAMPVPEYFLWTSCSIATVLSVFLIRADDYSLTTLSVLGLLSAAYLAVSWREPGRHIPMIVAGAAALAVLATWPVPQMADPIVSDPDLARLNPIATPEFSRFTTIAAVFAVLFGVTGFLAAGRSAMAGLWAGLSSAIPFLTLFIAYWRWTDFESDALWALSGVALAGAMTFAAERRANNQAALAAYAVVAVAALSLALAMVLREAWLTVALSIQLPAIAAIHRRINLKPLRYVALIIGGVVLARLLLNPSLLDYDLVETPILNWLLYGYGLPAAAFYFAAKWFLQDRDDLTVQVLEAGAIAFFTCLVSFQIRHLIGGQLNSPYDSFVEMSLQTAAWLALSYGLYAKQALQRRPVLRWASDILRIAGAAHLLAFQVLIYNPLFRLIDVGDWPLFNLLGLAYLVPAVFAALYARIAIQRGERLLARVAGLFALGLPLLYLTLEVRHLFQGPYLNGGDASQAEHYAYSAAWLAYAALLLALGLWRRSRELRIASLAVLMLATAKVFLFDMSSLEGVLRALSLLGLGATLVGISFLYRRLVPPATPAD